MTARRLRLARGLIAAVFGVIASAAAHAAAGGGLPGPLAIVASLVFALPVTMLVSRPRLSAWRLAVSVAFSQAVFHVLFSLGASGGVAFSGPAHLHAGEHIAVTAVPGAGMLMPDGPAMWIAHAIAGLVVVLALLHGERVLIGIAGIAARFVLAVVTLWSPARGCPAQPTGGKTVGRTSFFSPVPLRDRVARLGGLRHRGPPLLLAH